MPNAKLITRREEVNPLQEYLWDGEKFLYKSLRAVYVMLTRMMYTVRGLKKVLLVSSSLPYFDKFLFKDFHGMYGSFPEQEVFRGCVCPSIQLEEIPGDSPRRLNDIPS